MTRKGAWFATDDAIEWEAAGEGSAAMCSVTSRASWQFGLNRARRSRRAALAPSYPVQRRRERRLRHHHLRRGEAPEAGDSFLVPPDAVHGAVAVEAGVLVDVFTPMREDFVKD